MVDRSALGHEFPPYRLQVERGKIAEFARSILSQEQLYYSTEAARAAGFEDVPVPPTFSAVESHWNRNRQDVLKLDLRRVLAGGCEWEYLKPVVAGEVLTVRSRIADIQTKMSKRGPMSVIVRETRFDNEAGDTAFIARSTVLEMPPRDQGNDAA